MPSSFQPDQAPFEDRETSSSDSTSSSGGSSPILPLPDEVLRSFQFPDRQRVDATSGNAVEADRRGSGSSVQPSVNADEYRDAAANANDEDRTQSQYRNDLSEYDIPDLRLINAHYKALVLDHREQIIREIEANCEELGLDVRQQDWAALLKNLTATRPPTPRQGITANQTDLSHDEIQKQANPPQDIDPIPISEDQVAHESDTTLINGSPANSSSDTPAEPETPFRPLRALRGRKRAHSRLEQQSTDTADDREDEEAGEVVVRPRSPDRSQSLHSSDGGNEPGHESNSAMFVVNGIATRTAWSVVLDRYPDEVARVFRAGERPRNRQVESMVSSQNRVWFRNSMINAEASLIYLPLTLWWTILCAGSTVYRGGYRIAELTICWLFLYKSQGWRKLSHVRSARKDLGSGRDATRSRVLPDLRETLKSALIA